jgi:hypothetical protein
MFHFPRRPCADTQPYRLPSARQTGIESFIVFLGTRDESHEPPALKRTAERFKRSIVGIIRRVRSSTERAVSSRLLLKSSGGGRAAKTYRRFSRLWRTCRCGAGAPNPACDFFGPSELDFRRFILIALRPKICEGSMIEALVPYEPTGNSRVLFWEILLVSCASQRKACKSMRNW